jgi:vitamin K-dependent gamma-carboxylase
VDRLFRSIDASILAYFRIAFGALMLWEMLRFYFLGRMKWNWIHPDFHFTYLGFEWVSPLAGNGLQWVVAILAVAAIGVMIGFLYRVAALVFAVGITYLFLLDQTEYMNHFYLMCLLAWIAVVLPANACASVDALMRPGLRSEVVPAWTLLVLRFQLGIVYVYGGLAKLNGDWL